MRIFLIILVVITVFSLSNCSPLKSDSATVPEGISTIPIYDTKRYFRLPDSPVSIWLPIEPTIVNETNGFALQTSGMEIGISLAFNWPETLTNISAFQSSGIDLFSKGSGEYWYSSKAGSLTILTAVKELETNAGDFLLRVTIAYSSNTAGPIEFAKKIFNTVTISEEEIQSDSAKKYFELPSNLKWTPIASGGGRYVYRVDTSGKNGEHVFYLITIDRFWYNGDHKEKDEKWLLEMLARRGRTVSQPAKRNYIRSRGKDKNKAFLDLNFNYFNSEKLWVMIKTTNMGVWDGRFLYFAQILQVDRPTDDPLFQDRYTFLESIKFNN